MTWRRAPTWAWVLALVGLLVFLLGLLFLLVKTTDVITSAPRTQARTSSSPQ